MVIVGAKGLAKEIIQIIEEKQCKNNIYLYDDVNLNEPNVLYNKYTVLRNQKDVLSILKNDNGFILGLGSPRLRKILYNKFKKLGGRLESLYSGDVYIGEHVKIGEGCTLMSGVKISNSVSIGKGLLAYYNVIITHDVKIGDFVELSPNCKLLGHVEIQNNVQIGAGAIILPNIKVGKSAIVGAGAVVTKDVPANTVVAGNPARILN